ncbi:MAG: hypothetical protein APF76_05725 [Desulfitibacter sp. BRH_c19]|nr:MAG: hypothetical protein APF76_05725 [Desulfitibacter sp. BRH_c19]
MAEQTQSQTQETKPKRKWIKWVLILTIPLIIVSGLLGFYFSTVANATDDGTILMKDVQTVTIPSFTINLADAGHRRYLRTQITLEHAEKKLVSELELKGHRVKDTIINILREKKVVDLDSNEKTEALRQELIASINEILVDGEIIGLYFEEFIIQ